MPVILLIGQAYPGERIEGGPDWTRQPASGFDIDATFQPARAATPDEQREMLRALLADRFHVMLRRETRDAP